MLNSGRTFSSVIFFLIIFVISSISIDTCNAISEFPSSDVDKQYYKGLDVKASSSEFKEQLHKIISPHKNISYTAVWGAFIDFSENVNSSYCGLGKVTGAYSLNCWTPKVQQCGAYKKEGDCYNREHSWPKSWFGGIKGGSPALTDLHMLRATDGYVNGLRSNYPLGEVTDIKYESTNDSKLGKCNPAMGFKAPKNTLCFEVSKGWKGDFARIYFYMSVAYYKMFTCCDTESTDRWMIKDWQEALLRKWHAEDPVHQMEKDINEIIFERYQMNRNPFIDHPEWVDLIEDF